MATLNDVTQLYDLIKTARPDLAKKLKDIIDAQSFFAQFGKGAGEDLTPAQTVIFETVRADWNYDQTKQPSEAAKSLARIIHAAGGAPRTPPVPVLATAGGSTGHTAGTGAGEREETPSPIADLVANCSHDMLKGFSLSEKLRALEMVREQSAGPLGSKELVILRKIYRCMDLDPGFVADDKHRFEGAAKNVEAALTLKESPERETISNWDDAYAPTGHTLRQRTQSKKAKQKAARAHMANDNIDWGDLDNDTQLPAALKADLLAKKQVAERIVAEQCAAFGIHPPPPIVFTKPDAPGNDNSVSRGLYERVSGTIQLNPDPQGAFGDFADFVNTMMHECAHFYQHCLVKQLEDDRLEKTDPRYLQAKVFQINFLEGGYVRPDQDCADYKKQPVEDHSNLVGRAAQGIGAAIQKQISEEELNDFFKD
ncbi:hypothetical protein [Roseibium sp. RKSG952]|uniref:hypothetical protein n=1 Tax=Roseibium sp. RKSG952 TaxID=2529384 RepID=UPI0012BCA72E|nr:hypothetical protein [Roseibium sp. RKSG952]MTI00421.1 hypothetical protein [Roseibium sp. RKSG952]